MGRKSFILIAFIMSFFILRAEDLFEGYIAIDLNNILRYDFSKVYTNEDMSKIYINIDNILEMTELETIIFQPDKNTYRGHIDDQLFINSSEDLKVEWHIDDNTLIKDDGIYIRSDNLNKILPTEDISWDPESLKLTINFSFMLPVELKILGDEKRKRFLTVPIENKEEEVLKIRRNSFTPGILSLNFNWSDFNSGDMDLTYQYDSIFLYGELSLSGDIYESQSLDFYRQDYDNIIDGKTISLGKTALFNSPSLFRGSSGIKGFSINRKNIDYTTSSEKGEETIEGFAPISSTVEIYQNSFLIDFQIVGNEGFFKFSNIQSSSFSDNYTIKIYDEKGFFLEERRYSSLLKNNFMSKGETDYQLAFGEEDDDDNLVGGVDFYWGIFKRLTYNPGFYYTDEKGEEEDDDEDETDSYNFGSKVVKNSFLYRSKMIRYPYYTKLSTFTDLEERANSYDWEYKQKLFWDLQLDLYYTKNENDLEEVAEYSDNYSISLKKNWRKLYVTSGYEVTDEWDNSKEENYTFNSSYRYNNKIRVSFEEEYDKTDNSHQTTVGLDYSLEKNLSLSFDTGIYWGNDEDTKYYSLILSKSPSRKDSNYSFSTGLDYIYDEGDNEWDFFIAVNYYFGEGGTFTGRYDDDNNETFGLNYKKSFNLAKPLKTHPVNNNSGAWVEGYIFLDKNSNGIFDEDDIPFDNVEIASGGINTLSDKKGYYYLGGLASKNPMEIKYSYNNLDPTLMNLNESKKIEIAPTCGYEYNIPLVRSSGIMGSINFSENLKINERTKAMILARTKVELIKNDKIIKEIPVEPGGFFLTEGLKPGIYTLKANYLGVKDIKFKNKNLTLNINPTKYGNFYEDLKLEIVSYDKKYTKTSKSVLKLSKTSR